MVGDLAALGLHKVRGALVVDDSLFEGGYVPPAYDQKNDSTASRAPASAASLNGNVVAVTIVPGAAAGRARARRRRSAVALLHDRRARGHRRPAARRRPPSTPRRSPRTRASTSRAASALGADPRTFYRRVAQPSLFLGYTLKQLLERRGIAIGAVKVGTRARRRACACWPRTTRRRWRWRSRISTSGRTTSPPSSCCARWAPRSAAAPATGTRASRPWTAT